MKTLKTLFVAVMAVSFFSFSVLTEKKVNVEKSTINWTGKKVTGQHEGTISLKKGVLKFDGDKLIGGEFIIDMSTINVTDLEGKSKKSLEGHLKSDDFFGVENHETAKLTITKVSKQYTDYEITGDLTIKGITNPINFAMVVAENSAKANLTIDRSKFDVRYGSPSFFNDLKDKAIYDDFDLKVNLVY